MRVEGVYEFVSVWSLYLFGLESFYHVPSTAACLSVFSFHLIYCVWGLLSADWKVVVSHNCGVCLHG